MTGLIHTLVAFIVAIAVLVVVHEFGHYWVAKKLGVKVLRFSIGFGRPLWLRRFGRDQTEWVIAAVPLGGYVKMLDENEGKVEEHEMHRAFNRQSTPKRAAIVLAGPMFNFLFAILAYWLLFSIGAEGLKPVVGKIVDGSIAASAGFRVGDEILAIDGKSVTNWEQRRLYLFQRALSKESVAVEVRDVAGARRTRRLDLSGLTADQVSAGLLEKGLGIYPYVPEIPPVIDLVEEKGPAARGGLHSGDRILAIDGAAVQNWTDVQGAIHSHPGMPMRYLVERAGAQLSLEITPEKIERAGQVVGRIGAGVKVPDLPPEMRVFTRLGPLDALSESVQNTWLMSSLTLNMLYKMVKLEVSTKTISGPITIAQYAGYSAQVGWDRFLMFLAVVSISLGVLNLLPIPILDGGHLLVYLIEAVIRGPLSERALIWGQQVGVTLLLGLMALAFYNDLVRVLQ
jgi:regulator of sigma E protease